MLSLHDVLQIIGGVGVIASLIYVAVQIRANARAVRAQTYQQVTGNVLVGWNALAASGDLTELLLAGLDDFHALDRVAKARFRFFCMAFIRTYENAWFQYTIGTLQEGDWKSIAGDMDSVFSTPGARAVWPQIKNRNSPEFQAVVETVIKRQLEAQAQKSSENAPQQKQVLRKRKRG